MTLALIIVSVALIVGLVYFLWSEYAGSEYKKIWQEQAPPLFQNQYNNFFSATPTQNIFENQLKTIWKLVNAMQNTGVEIAHVDFGFRDPATNVRVGGAASSRHMLGKAIDFRTSRQLLPEEMERLGQHLNRNGLHVIFYPFGSTGKAIHIQLSDSAAQGKRRLYYERRMKKKSYASSYQEAERT